MMLDEMAALQADEVERLYRNVEAQKLDREARAKAKMVAAAVKEHLPPQVLQDLLDLCTPVDAEYFAQALLHPVEDQFWGWRSRVYEGTGD